MRGLQGCGNYKSAGILVCLNQSERYLLEAIKTISIGPIVQLLLFELECLVFDEHFFFDPKLGSKCQEGN